MMKTEIRESNGQFNWHVFVGNQEFSSIKMVNYRMQPPIETQAEAEKQLAVFLAFVKKSGVLRRAK